MPSPIRLGGGARTQRTRFTATPDRKEALYAMGSSTGVSTAISSTALHRPSLPVCSLHQQNQIMGLGVDLEEAARPADYYESFANPRDDEAPTVWGYRAPGCRSRMSVEDRICIPVLTVTILATVLISGAYIYAAGLNPASFAGAMNPGNPGRVVSPVFGVKLQMNNTCVDRANVVVAYAGVALGWAHAEPWDCEEERRTKEVEVVARDEGIGLPELLRDRMAEETGPV
ncbi:hypothetical protein HU200_055187 [Digitaria exilis]|uniref:Uncharacterized protein n=1 Tax=Digitaria exilis TaxID=1010633 RepID=A0A835ANK2_9POAL|nr:hypothetical protein HU200_055187 [Digitaria exilis]